MWGSLKEWGRAVVGEPIKAGDRVTELHTGASCQKHVEHIGIIILNGNCDIVTTSVCLNVSFTPEEGRLNQPVNIFL